MWLRPVAGIAIAAGVAAVAVVSLAAGNREPAGIGRALTPAADPPLPATRSRPSDPTSTRPLSPPPASRTTWSLTANTHRPLAAHVLSGVLSEDDAGAEASANRRPKHTRVRSLDDATSVFCLLLVAVRRAAGHAGDPEAREWLERMSGALSTQNYDGRFFHLQSRSETMRIIHRVDKGKITERLVSLDGSGAKSSATKRKSSATCRTTDGAGREAHRQQLADVGAARATTSDWRSITASSAVPATKASAEKRRSY